MKTINNENKKVFVSGCFDLIHAGHIEFLRLAAEYGDLYVGLGSDITIQQLKHHQPLYSETERLFIIKSIKYVHNAIINSGNGYIDFENEIKQIKPDIFIVNEDGDSEEKKILCKNLGIEYKVLKRTPPKNIKPTSSSSIKSDDSFIPTRIDIAGEWLDQPCVSSLYDGSVITISVVPNFEIRGQCGLATSTRNKIKEVWPIELPDIKPEILAKLVFCYENDPDNKKGYISGAQDAIGICVPGIVKQDYSGKFWPSDINVCKDKNTIAWLEEHICLVPIKPRHTKFNIKKGCKLTKNNVKELSTASNKCWNAIINMDLGKLGESMTESFMAQINIFPEGVAKDVQEKIDKYSNHENVLATKLTGAGGGGYLVLLCKNKFPINSIPITIYQNERTKAYEN